MRYWRDGETGESHNILWILGERDSHPGCVSEPMSILKYIVVELVVASLEMAMIF